MVWMVEKAHFTFFRGQQSVLLVELNKSKDQDHRLVTSITSSNEKRHIQKYNILSLCISKSLKNESETADDWSLLSLKTFVVWMWLYVRKRERESPKNSLNEYACSIFVYNAIREWERSGVGFSGRGDVIRCKQEKSDSLTMAMLMGKNPWPGFFFLLLFLQFSLCLYKYVLLLPRQTKPLERLYNI